MKHSADIVRHHRCVKEIYENALARSKRLRRVGFEPTSTNTMVLETIALDRSAIDACCLNRTYTIHNACMQSAPPPQQHHYVQLL